MTRISTYVAIAALALTAGCKKEQPQSGAGAAGAQGGQPQAATGGAPGGAAAGPQGCNSDLSQAISANTTFTKACSPYTVASRLSVEGWDLTIEPGVELRFGPGAELSVGYNGRGRIVARGTPEAPIRFVSQGRQEPGAWNGIALYPDAAGTTFENAVIENVGLSDRAAVQVQAKDVTLKAVRFAGVKGRALSVQNDVELAAFETNDLSGAKGEDDVVVSAPMATLARAKGNKLPAGKILLAAGMVHDDLRLEDPGAPIRIDGDLRIEAAEQTKLASLKIGPGVVLQFGEGTTLSVGYNGPGAFEAKGTAEKPVVFTSSAQEPVAGGWTGLVFYEQARAPVLDYVRIQYAGAAESAAVQYNGPKGLGAFTHVTVSKSAGKALALNEAGAPFTAFSDNTFEEIGKPAVIDGLSHLASNLGSGNRYPKDSVIQIHSGVKQDTKLTAQGIPYLCEGDLQVEGEESARPTTLELEPATELQFTDGASLVVADSGQGTLKAVGAPNKPIRFTAAQESWGGLRIRERGRVTLENAVFEKLSTDQFAIEVGAETSGSIKSVKLVGSKNALKKCSETLSTDKISGKIETGC